MNTVIKSRSRQKGMSSFGWIAVAGVFGFLLITFFKVFPMYMDMYTLRSVLTSIKDDSSIDAKSKSDIWQSMQKRLYINEVKSIKLEHVTMTRKDGKTTVTVAYEARNPYIGNLFIGGNFSESVVIDR